MSDTTELPPIDRDSFAGHDDIPRKSLWGDGEHHVPHPKDIPEAELRVLRGGKDENSDDPFEKVKELLNDGAKSAEEAKAKAARDMLDRHANEVTLLREMFNAMSRTAFEPGQVARVKEPFRKLTSNGAILPFPNNPARGIVLEYFKDGIPADRLKDQDIPVGIVPNMLLLTMDWKDGETRVCYADSRFFELDPEQG